jgi:hypothetical protein
MSVTSEKPSLFPTLSCLDISSLNSLNKKMNTEGCFKKNHPKRSRPDQKARKTLQMANAAHDALEDQQSNGLEKVCKRLFKLPFGRNTTRCHH